MPKKQKTNSGDFPLIERPYKKIAITFLVLAALLVGVISYFSLSRAVIVLVPKDEERIKTFETQVFFKDTGNANDLVGVYSEKTLNIAKSFEVKEFKTVEGKAHGTITIFNKSAKSQPLIATTRFLSPNNLLFRLKNSVTVPAGGEVTAEIEADEMGQKYEIAPTTFTIPGLSNDLQKKIYGVSKETMAGGVKKIGKVGAAEIAEAQKAMLNSLDEATKAEIGTKDGKVILFEKEIKSENVSAKDGEEVEKFTITVKVLAKIAEIDEEKLVSSGKEQFQKAIAEGEEIKSFNLDAFAYALKELAPESAKINISVSAFVLSQPDTADFNKQKLYGLDAKGAKFYLTQFGNIKDAEILFSPFWVKTIPSLADHIEIRIKQ